jgi:hypothetical protein
MGGHIMNPKTASTQMMGVVAWDIGMGKGGGVPRQCFRLEVTPFIGAYGQPHRQVGVRFGDCHT